MEAQISRPYKIDGITAFGGRPKQVMAVESRKAVSGKPFAHAPSLDGDLPRAKVVALAID